VAAIIGYNFSPLWDHPVLYPEDPWFNVQLWVS